MFKRRERRPAGWPVVLTLCLALAAACGSGSDGSGQDAGPRGGSGGGQASGGTGGSTASGGTGGTTAGMRRDERGIRRGERRKRRQHGRWRRYRFGRRDGKGGSGGGGSTGTGGVAGSGGAAGKGGSGGGGSTGAGGVSGSGGAAGKGGSGTGGSGAAGQSGTGVVAAGVRWVGRVDLTDAQHPRFSWSGTGFVASFSGTSLSIQINSSGAFIFKPVVDGAPRATLTIPSGQQTASVASGLGAGMHTVELYRQTEGSQGDSQLMGITVGGGALAAPPAAPARLIEVIGDSISCGYGTLGMVSDSDCFPTESAWDTYESVAARALGADVSTIAMSGQGAYRNYGGDMSNTLPMVYTRALTNDASPAWDFRTQAQAVIVNLGTNDISNSKGDPGTPFETAYTGLLASVRGKYPGGAHRLHHRPPAERQRSHHHRGPHPEFGQRPRWRPAITTSSSSTRSPPRPPTRPPASTTPTPPRTRSWRPESSPSCARASAGEAAALCIGPPQGAGLTARRSRATRTFSWSGLKSSSTRHGQMSTRSPRTIPLVGSVTSYSTRT